MTRVIRCALLFFGAISLANPCFAQDLASQPSIWVGKPDAAAFDKSEDDHLASVVRAIDQIEKVKGARTIENTLVPFDEAVRDIDSAGYLATFMQQVHPDPGFRNHAAQAFVKIGKVFNELNLNRSVYDALDKVDLSHADVPTRYYVQRTLLEFRLAGVDKDDATRKQMQKLQDELIAEQTAFDRNIQESEKTVLVDSVSELDGLPPDYIQRHKPQADGKIHITTQYPDIQPALEFAKSENLRLRLQQALDTRAYPQNRDVLKRMMSTRYDIARLAGYSSWADYNAADKMIRNGANIATFIHEIDAAKPVAQREFAALLEEWRKTHPAATEIGDYNRTYLEEQVRRSKYDFDSQSLRPYLPFDEVKAGVLDTAAKLFQVEFRQEQSAPAWTSDVETWDVYTRGKVIGRFYLDLHPRNGKYSHANMVPVLDGIKGKQLPEAALVCNLPSPKGDDPGLMDYADLNTFFHEFGHLMHWILSAQQWAGLNFLSGLESDFVEAPSSMLEDWLESPQVLISFARHYKTGEQIPAALIAQMNRAEAFGRGILVTRQNELTAISYDLYKTNPDSINLDEVVVEDARRYTLFVPTPDVHYYASFVHLSSYSSAYYTYLWDRVIAEDFFTQFNATDLFAGTAPERYRRLVLEPGGSSSANDLVRNFLGRPQNTAAFKHWLSKEFETRNEGAPGS